MAAMATPTPIPYSQSSKFFDACIDAVKEKGEIKVGETLTVDLGESGMDGLVTAKIDPENDDEFLTDYGDGDAAKFSNRIKAMATTLYEFSRFGTYKIESKDGNVTVERLKDDALK